MLAVDWSVLGQGDLICKDFKEEIIIMEGLDVFVNTYNKHCMKIWKKNKCKRMLRKIGKKFEKD